MYKIIALLVASLFSLTANQTAYADTISDWMARAALTFQKTRSPHEPATPQRFRLMSWVGLSMFEAANSVDPQYRSYLGLERSRLPASDALAAAAAARTILATQFPDQERDFEEAFKANLAQVADEASRTNSIAIGERVAKLVLQKGRLARPVVPYRPYTTPGTWVPTTLPAIEPFVLALSLWFVDDIDQFPLQPPPSLTSDRYTRDFNETRILGAKNSTARSEEQTRRSLFWDRSYIYEIPDQVDRQPGRTVVQNARMYALYTMTIDDAEVLLGTAKMRFAAWRPITAIRNADKDSNPNTQREADWLPLLDTPVHPEYPCGHCVISQVVAQILSAEGKISEGYSFRSRSVPGVTVEIPDLEEYASQVSMSRIHGGVHFRYAAVEGHRIATLISSLALKRFGHTPSQ